MSEDNTEKTETFLDRLYTEHSEVKGRLKCLTAFIGTDKFEALNDSAKLYMQQQHEVMVLYVDILEKRISLATGKQFPPKEEETDAAGE